MEVKVNFLDKLRLEAKFDDFTVIADQPIRYKGDGSAPGPFDYFLASWIDSIVAFQPIVQRQNSAAA